MSSRRAERRTRTARPASRGAGGAAMCRWLAYSGTPILLEELLYNREHSLIDQSLHSRMGVETTNGDGSGVGWYGVGGGGFALPAPGGRGIPVLVLGVG